MSAEPPHCLWSLFQWSQQSFDVIHVYIGAPREQDRRQRGTHQVWKVQGRQRLAGGVDGDDLAASHQLRPILLIRKYVLVRLQLPAACKRSMDLERL